MNTYSVELIPEIQDEVVVLRFLPADVQYEEVARGRRGAGRLPADRAQGRIEHLFGGASELVRPVEDLLAAHHHAYILCSSLHVSLGLRCKITCIVF